KAGVDFRQLLGFHLVDSNLELDGRALQVLSVIILREGQLERGLFARLLPLQAIFKARDHGAGAEHQVLALGGTAGERFAVLETFVVDIDAVAIGGGAVFLCPGGALLAQGVDHLVDIGIADIGAQLLDADAVKGGQADLRVHVKGGGKLEVLAVLNGFRLELRHAGRLDLFLLDRLEEAFAHYFTEDFVTHGTTKAALHFTHRDFTGTKTVDTHGLLRFGQTLFDLRRQVLGRNADGHATTET